MGDDAVVEIDDESPRQLEIREDTIEYMSDHHGEAANFLQQLAQFLLNSGKIPKGPGMKEQELNKRDNQNLCTKMLRLLNEISYKPILDSFQRKINKNRSDRKILLKKRKLRKKLLGKRLPKKQLQKKRRSKLQLRKQPLQLLVLDRLRKELSSGMCDNNRCLETFHFLVKECDVEARFEMLHLFTEDDRTGSRLIKYMQNGDGLRPREAMPEE